MELMRNMKNIATSLVIAVTIGCGSDNATEENVSLNEVHEQREYNDDVSGSQSVYLNSRVLGHLDSTSDFNDWYAFTVIAGDTITLELSGDAGTDFDLYFHHNLQGQLAASEHDSSTENITHTFTEDGYLYAVVRLYGNSPEGDYELVITTDGVGSAGNEVELGDQSVLSILSLHSTSYCHDMIEGGAEAIFNYELSNWVSGQCQGNFISECRITSRPIVEQGFDGRNQKIHLTHNAVDSLGGHTLAEKSCEKLKAENTNLTFTYKIL